MSRFLLGTRYLILGPLPALHSGDRFSRLAQDRQHRGTGNQAELATAPPELAGAASATNNASMQLGSSLGIAVMGALFQGFARKAYFSDLTALGLGAAEIEKSVEVLSAWLKANAGDVASQFGTSVRQLEGVIGNYQNAYTTGVAGVLRCSFATTYLRAGYLPDPYATESRQLLREYVDQRLEALDRAKLAQALARSEEIHSELWTRADRGCLEYPNKP